MATGLPAQRQLPDHVGLEGRGPTEAQVTVGSSPGGLGVRGPGLSAVRLRLRLALGQPMPAVPLAEAVPLGLGAGVGWVAPGPGHTEVPLAPTLLQLEHKWGDRASDSPSDLAQAPAPAVHGSVLVFSLRFQMEGQVGEGLSWWWSDAGQRVRRCACATQPVAGARPCPPRLLCRVPGRGELGPHGPMTLRI